ncbi:MAG TPA: hypothetical protein DF712_07610 [Balneola sp.]|nr:hypothetical protein [Balneola sp.]
METLSISTLVSAVAIITFLYSYIKDRYESGRVLGQMQERISKIERDSQVTNNLIQTLTDTRLTVVRLEQKVDSITEWINKQ